MMSLPAIWRSTDFSSVGEDHLGHGESVKSDEYHGYFGEDGNAWIIADIHQLRLMMAGGVSGSTLSDDGTQHGIFPAQTVYHRKGREVCKELAGVIVMGTGWQPNLMLRPGHAWPRCNGLEKGRKKAKADRHPASEPILKGYRIQGHERLAHQGRRGN